MSSFDDEFGLFGEETEEAERRSTLGARRYAGETVINDVELEGGMPRRRERGPRSGRGDFGGGFSRGRRPERRHQPADPDASRHRAGELLAFLAQKLVSNPDAVSVDVFPPEDGYQAQIELVVDPEDLGKVIGRSGRVAQALRTIVRATAEGKVAVEILDTEEGFDEEDDAAADAEAEADAEE